MKVVIADTSPINYLILIEEIDLLRKLYTRIVIPPEVFQELISAGAPPEVAAWMQSRPTWVKVRSPLVTAPVASALTEAELDAGEQAAIRLALVEHDVLLLIDEAIGRSVAAQLGIANTGTLGVLVAAAEVGLVDLRISLSRLLSTNFRISQSLINKLLTEAHQRNPNDDL